MKIMKIRVKIKLKKMNKLIVNKNRKIEKYNFNLN